MKSARIALLIVLVAALSIAGAFTAVAFAQTLTVIGASGTEVNYIKKIAPDYPAAEIVVEETPWPQYFEKLMIEFVNRTGRYDVVAVPAEWMLALAPFLEPLDPYAADFDTSAFVPSIIEGFIHEGKLYGIPRNFNILLGYYRTDIFEELGLSIPTTWEEYRDTLIALKQTSDPDIIAPGTLPMMRGSHNAVEFFQYLWSFGGDLTDEQGNAALTSPAAHQALKFMYDQYHTWRIVPVSAFEMSYIESGEAFTQGMVATAWDWPRRIALARDPNTSRVVGKWSVFARPGVPWIGAWAWAIPADSRNKEAAFEFIRWITNEENDLGMALEGILTGRISSLENELVLEQTPELAVARQAAERGKTPPKAREYERIMQIVSLEVSEALTGAKSIEQALQDANRQVDRLLKQQ